MKINPDIATASVTGLGGGVGFYLSTVNAALSFVVLVCSAIVGVYGVYRIYEDRKQRRAAAMKCIACPDKPK